MAKQDEYFVSSPSPTGSVIIDFTDKWGDVLSFEEESGYFGFTIDGNSVAITESLFLQALRAVGILKDPHQCATLATDAAEGEAT